MIKLIAIVLALLLGGGGAGSFLFGGSDDGYTDPDYSQQSQQSQTGMSGSLLSMLGNLGGGSVSSGWDSQNNTGKLDTTVATGSREKYTEILGNGQDEMTIMLYLCGTDLESKNRMATMDLQEMLDAQISDQINLIV